MNKLPTFLSICLISALLISCGGGGGGSSSAAPTTTPTVTPSTSSFFTLVPNSVTINSAGTDEISIVNVPIDINKDGFDDLVMQFSNTQKIGGQTVNTPCTNRLVVLINQGNNTFLDKTATYINGAADLGGCARKARVADFNGDGRLDIVYAMNQEDGRDINNLPNLTAQVAALISTGSSYRVSKFGTANFYHSAGFGYNATGNPFLVSGGYFNVNNPTQSFTYDQSNNLTTETGVLPAISPWSFEFIPTGATNESTLLIQPMADTSLPLNSFTFSGYQKGIGGAWSALSNYTPFANAPGTVSFSPYYSQTYATPQNVVSMNGLYYLSGSGGGIPESCKLKLTPNSSVMTIFTLAANMIPNYTPNITMDQARLIEVNKFIGIGISGNTLSPINLNIDNEQYQYVNSNFFDCVDINNDGYTDLIRYPYNSNGMPYVYLNTKSNSFAYLGQSQFPTLPTTITNCGAKQSSMLHDFNRDGIPDLFVWTSNGKNCSSNSYTFYNGNKLLQ